MEGGENATAEIWVTVSGHPYIFPYCRKGDKDRFLELAVDDNLSALI